MKMNYIYLDDVRTPSPNPSTHEVPEWIVVRSYDEFVSKVMELGLETIKLISLDHDLGDTAMKEYFTNVSPNYKSANIMGYVNNFFMNEAQPQTCVRVNIPHFIEDTN